MDTTDCIALRTDSPFVHAAQKCVDEALNAAIAAQGCFGELTTLFNAVADASHEHSQAAKLAGIGAHMAEDLERRQRAVAEELERHLNALRAQLGRAPWPCGEARK